MTRIRRRDKEITNINGMKENPESSKIRNHHNLIIFTNKTRQIAASFLDTKRRKCDWRLVPFKEEDYGFRERHVSVFS